MRVLLKNWFNRKMLKDQQTILSAQMEMSVKRSKEAADRLTGSLRNLLAENDRIKLHGAQNK